MPVLFCFYLLCVCVKAILSYFGWILGLDFVMYFVVSFVDLPQVLLTVTFAALAGCIRFYFIIFKVKIPFISYS